MIDVQKLSKRFGAHQAVDQVSLQIGSGQIFGLLGPNAAGKTTLIRLVCGLLRADSGLALINQLPVEQAKQQFGYVAQHFGQYEELTVAENLRFYAQLYGVKDRAVLDALLERYGLQPFRHAFAGTLSGGYKRRLALACALAHDPAVLFLDEPTAGIDPVTRKSLWDEFYSLSAAGKTLFVTTHYMEEAERCHQLAFISAGKIVAEGSPQTIKAALGNSLVYTCAIPAPLMASLPALRKSLEQLPKIRLINQFGDMLRLVTQADMTAEAIRQALPEHARDIQISADSANLEDVFIALTQSAEAES